MQKVTFSYHKNVDCLNPSTIKIKNSFLKRARKLEEQTTVHSQNPHSDGQIDSKKEFPA